MSSPAQLPFYSLVPSASASLPVELLLAVEELTGIPTLPLRSMPANLTESSVPTTPLNHNTVAPLEQGDATVVLPKLAPPLRTTRKKNKVSFLGSQPANPSRMAMSLVNEPSIEGAWPDQTPFVLPKWQQRVQGQSRSAWLRDTVVIGLLATKTVVNAFTQSEVWVYKALQASVVGVLCLNIFLGCINIGHQLIVASIQKPYAEQLASETKSRHHEIDQSLIALKKGEGVEMLARGYMDMVEPNQVLVKVR
jgi:hypothetical protein